MTLLDADPKYFEASAASEERGRRSLASQIGLPFLLSRIWVTLFVYAGHLAHPFREQVAGSYAGVSNWWLNPWTNFDSIHYLSIARDGYTPQTASFYPLYPLLLRLGGADENIAALLGITVSNAALWLGLGVLWRLTQHDYGSRIATIAVWLTAFCPTSAFFSAVYTESLFLWLLTATFWNARVGNWGRAALFALGAALTKNSGFLIALALWLEMIRARQNEDSETNVPHAAIFAPFLPLLGFIGVQLYFSTRFGAGAGLASQQFYGRAWSWPWLPLWRDGIDILAARALELTTLLHFSFAIIAIIIVWRDWKKQPASSSLLLGGVMLMQLGFSRIVPPYTIATARYLSTFFPFVQRIAVRLESTLDGSNGLRIGIVALIYALLCALMSYLFGLKSFVG